MVLAHETRYPRRRSTRGILRPVAQQLVETLGLEPPRASDPGYWKTRDGFVAVNAGLIMDGFTTEFDQLRCLISFEPRDVQATVKERARAEFPDFDTMPSPQRRAVWARILQIGKQVRTERVVEIVNGLEPFDIEIPAYSIVVHRVSNTFFATLDLETLQKILMLRVSDGYAELRRISVQKVTNF